MPTISEMYNNSIAIHHDISEHMPILREYAGRVNSIVELGVRGGNSTVAFLSGLRKEAWIRGYDNWSESTVAPDDILIMQAQAKSEGIDFELVTANDLEIEIPECDLLFIDTLHVEAQVTAELKLHAPKVKKYIIFHDTITFGLFSEEDGQQHRGIMFSIIRFLDNNPEWMVSKHFTYNNGLLILRKR